MTGIVVIGSREFLIGFKLAGLKEVYATEEVSAEETFNALLTRKESGVVVTDGMTFDSLNRKLQEQLRRSVQPVLVVLHDGKEADDDLREAIKTAMGVDIWEME